MKIQMISINITTQLSKSISCNGVAFWNYLMFTRNINNDTRILDDIYKYYYYYTIK